MHQCYRDRAARFLVGGGGGGGAALKKERVDEISRGVGAKILI